MRLNEIEYNGDVEFVNVVIVYVLSNCMSRKYLHNLERLPFIHCQLCGILTEITSSYYLSFCTFSFIIKQGSKMICNTHSPQFLVFEKRQKKSKTHTHSQPEE